MRTLTQRLDEFEAKIQAFIEGKLSRLSPVHDNNEALSHLLVSSMRDGTVKLEDGTLLAPDKFTLLVHPLGADNLNNDPETLWAMAELIKKSGEQSGLFFGHPPTVSVALNEDVPVDKIDIVSRISNQALNQTGSLIRTASPEAMPIQAGNSMPPDAFLIINGTEVYALEKPVINIGRSRNNHILIEDPRVSRKHAQIRASRGRYEIFDLDSTGGTFINQTPIKQSPLHPGDVISLAGVNIIYGHEIPSAIKNTRKLTRSDIFEDSEQ